MYVCMSVCPLLGSGGVFFGVSSFGSVTRHGLNNVVMRSFVESVARQRPVNNNGVKMPNCVGVKYENKNMVTGPDGALHQE
jgi:hypothetical protein